MADKTLRDLLEQLRIELGKAGSLDEKGRELLRTLDADIQKILGGPSSPQPVQERLQEAIDHFEVDHPAITAALSQILNTLSNAGI